MALERPHRRKAPFSGSCDPRTYIASGYVTYVEQFVEGSWHEIFELTGWRPSTPFVIGRDKLDARTIRYLTEWKGK